MLLGIDVIEWRDHRPLWHHNKKCPEFCILVRTFGKVLQTFFISCELADSKEAGDYFSLANNMLLPQPLHRHTKSPNRGRIYFFVVFFQTNMLTKCSSFMRIFSEQKVTCRHHRHHHRPHHQKCNACVQHTVQLHHLNVLDNTLPPPSALSNVVKTTSLQTQTCSGGKSICVVI